MPMSEEELREKCEKAFGQILPKGIKIYPLLIWNPKGGLLLKTWAIGLNYDKIVKNTAIEGMFSEIYEATGYRGKHVFIINWEQEKKGFSEKFHYLLNDPFAWKEVYSGAAAKMFEAAHIWLTWEKGFNKLDDEKLVLIIERTVEEYVDDETGEVEQTTAYKVVDRITLARYLELGKKSSAYLGL